MDGRRARERPWPAVSRASWLSRSSGSVSRQRWIGQLILEDMEIQSTTKRARVSTVAPPAGCTLATPGARVQVDVKWERRRIGRRKRRLLEDPPCTRHRRRRDILDREACEGWPGSESYGDGLWKLRRHPCWSPCGVPTLWKRTGMAGAVKPKRHAAAEERQLRSRNWWFCVFLAVACLAARIVFAWNKPADESINRLLEWIICTIVGGSVGQLMSLGGPKKPSEPFEKNG